MQSMRFFYNIFFIFFTIVFVNSNVYAMEEPTKLIDVFPKYYAEIMASFFQIDSGILELFASIPEKSMLFDGDDVINGKTCIILNQLTHENSGLRLKLTTNNDYGPCEAIEKINCTNPFYLRYKGDSSAKIPSKDEFEKEYKKILEDLQTGWIRETKWSNDNCVRYFFKKSTLNCPLKALLLKLLLQKFNLQDVRCIDDGNDIKIWVKTKDYDRFQGLLDLKYS